ncbi:MAG TPA: hypothetical protein VEQ42_03915 [Pyrinomonadaceae bacterium]|nr:hypothetical protein [Pyrinomonadaceae bacterium]
MSMLIDEQRDDRVVLQRLRRMQRLRRQRQRRHELVLKRSLEILGWLTGLLIFIYASHAAFAQTTSAAVGRGPAARFDAAGRSAEEAASEEAEARELLTRALARLRETEDIASLFGDAFVRDLAARLRGDAKAYPFEDVVAPSVVAEASDEELLRLYAAVTNCLSALMRRGALRHALGEASGVGDEADGEDGLMKSALEELLRTEPSLAAVAADIGLKLDADADEDEFMPEAKTVRQMRGMIVLFEKMAGLVRGRASTLEARLAAFGVPAEATRGEAKIESVSSDVFYDDRYGFKAGAPNVRAKVEVFPGVTLRLTLVREGARLKLLSAEPLLDSE